MLLATNPEIMKLPLLYACIEVFTMQDVKPNDVKLRGYDSELGLWMTAYK